MGQYFLDTQYMHYMQIQSLSVILVIPGSRWKSGPWGLIMKSGIQNISEGFIRQSDYYFQAFITDFSGIA